MASVDLTPNPPPAKYQHVSDIVNRTLTTPLAPAGKVLLSPALK